MSVFPSEKMTNAGPSIASGTFHETVIEFFHEVPGADVIQAEDTDVQDATVVWANLVEAPWTHGWDDIVAEQLRLLLDRQVPDLAGCAKTMQTHCSCSHESGLLSHIASQPCEGKESFDGRPLYLKTWGDRLLGWKLVELSSRLQTICSYPDWLMRYDGLELYLEAKRNTTLHEVMCKIGYRKRSCCSENYIHESGDILETMLFLFVEDKKIHLAFMLLSYITYYVIQKRYERIWSTASGIAKLSYS